MVLLCWIACLAALQAAPAQPHPHGDSVASSTVVTVTLDPVTSLPWPNRYSGSPAPNADFRREPAFKGTDVRRGVVAISPHRHNWIGYAWDVDGGVVYVDLNRDQDLSNDPAGMLKLDTGRSWAECRFETDISTGTLTERAGIELYLHRAVPVRPSKTSGWMGQASIAGRPYFLAATGVLADDVASPRLLAISTSATAAGRHGYTKPGEGAHALLGNRLYDVSVARREDTSGTRVVAEIEESSMPKEQVLLEAQDVEEAYLHSRTWGKVCMISPTSGTIELPEGTYRLVSAVLRGGNRNYGVGAGEFQVTCGRPTTVRLGGPLRHAVTARRAGAFLLLDIEATGLGGEKYSTNAESGQYPEFAIFKGNRKLASGRFEYG